MIGHLPTPYPDETIYSVLARLKQRCGVTSVELDKELFGKEIACKSPRICFQVNQLASKLSHLNGLSTKQIIVSHTIWPYISRFFPPPQSDYILHQIQTSDRCDAIQKAGLALLPDFNVPFYCPECLRVDTDNFGEPYWHVTHQLPGILVCLRHDCFLEKSPSHSRTFTTAFRAASETINGVSKRTRWNESDKIQAVARWILKVYSEKSSKPFKHLEQEDLLDDIQWLEYPTRYGRKKLILNSIQNFFRKELRFYRQQHAGKLFFRSIHINRKNGPNPIPFSLLSNYQRTLMINQSRRITSEPQQSQECPNKICPQYGMANMKKTKRSKGVLSICTYSWSCNYCECVIVIHYDQNGKPVSKSLRTYGSLWLLTATTLFHSESDKLMSGQYLGVKTWKMNVRHQLYKAGCHPRLFLSD